MGYIRHGQYKSKMYRCWQHMKTRCYNNKDKRYHDYGGRGISVCERWLESFDNFFEDMKDTHSENLQLDRINNNGNYCKENCRWVRATINMSNRRPKTELPRGIRVRPSGNYQARIGIEGVEYNLGFFKNIKDASDIFELIHKEWYGV